MKLAELTEVVGYAGDPYTAKAHIERKAEKSAYARLGKRIFDFCFSVAILPVFIPIIAILWLIVRSDGGPGFFGHTRVGKNGQKFRCWKIRTMVPNAEESLRKHLEANPKAAAEWAKDHKLENDPRVTRLGAFLRKTSLDELPQFWNVLRGEMSLVGPRPIVTAELDKYGVYQDGYLSVKPGVTGLWQVSGRNNVTYDERVAMDMRYLASVSLMLDVKIVLRTAMSMIDRTGK